LTGARSPALATLALLLRGHGDAARARIEAGRPPPEAFLAFCARHQLRLLLLETLRPDGFERAFGSAALREIEAFRERRVRRQDALLDELERLAPRLARAGLPFLLLKGPHLAQRFHGGPHRRFYGDLDLLVRRRDLAAARALLAREGYARRSAILFSERLTLRFTHGYDFVRGDLRLDLHWSLGVSAAYALDGEAFWQESRCFAFRGHELRVLSDEHCLMALLVSLFEDLARGAARLKGLADVHRVLAGSAGPPDWAGFFARRAAEGTEGPCRAVLRLFLDWLGMARDFPGLEAELGPPEGAVASPALLLESGRGARANRRWAAAHSDASRAAVLRFWLFGLPFRVAVHRPGRLPRLGRRA